MIINERFHNAITNEITDIEREATEEELKHYQELLTKRNVQAAEDAAKAAAKQAVLDKLGLSAEEVAALLG